MIEPRPKDIGRAVIYKPRHAGMNQLAWESGVITSYNPFYVFVRYDADQNGKSTRRELLDWAHPDTEERK